MGKIILIFLLTISNFCYSQIKSYNNNYDLVIFEKNIVILFQNYYFDCIKDSIIKPNKPCEREKDKIVDVFISGRFKPSDFEEQSKNSKSNYSKIKKQLSELYSYDLSRFLENEGFLVINVNYIKSDSGIIDIQYYLGSSMMCEFYNVRINTLTKKPFLEKLDSGIIKIKE